MDRMMMRTMDYKRNQRCTRQQLCYQSTITTTNTPKTKFLFGTTGSIVRNGSPIIVVSEFPQLVVSSTTLLRRSRCTTIMKLLVLLSAFIIVLLNDCFDVTFDVANSHHQCKSMNYVVFVAAWNTDSNRRIMPHQRKYNHNNNHHHHHHEKMIQSQPQSTKTELSTGSYNNNCIPPPKRQFAIMMKRIHDDHDGADDSVNDETMLSSLLTTPTTTTTTTTTTRYRRRTFLQHTMALVATATTTTTIARQQPVTMTQPALAADVMTVQQQQQQQQQTRQSPPVQPSSLTTKQLSVGKTTRATNSAVLCDSTISVWTINGRAGDGNGGRGGGDAFTSSTVYLLGTAHISDVSASLAGTLVRQVHPDAVFVELDIKRIQNLPTMPAIITTTSSSSSNDDAPIISAKPAILVPKVPSLSSLDSSLSSNAPSSSSMDSGSTTTNGSTSSSSGGNKNWLQRRMLNIAGTVVGKGISSMYSNLSSSGFQPGEEFAEAIRAGREMDATIVLGDQDVQITLRRLAEALSMTDLNQLLNPDSQLEQTMSNLLPSLPPSLDGSSSSSKSSSAENGSDPTQFKRELSEYVEQMKSRDTVRTIIQELNVLAPDVVRVMLTERDMYMANGIHTLRQSYPKVVAVMGLAHIDGVERTLQNLGWKPVQLTCPK